MPPRLEDLAAHGVTPEVSVHLVDVEPVLGLVAAATRFCSRLTQPAYAAMSEDALDALSQIQSLLWRLEHATVASAPTAPEGG